MSLERETVVRVALALLNEVGFDGLTVRRLAARLGVQNPALYWHFQNKQELLTRMAQAMLAEAFAEVKLLPASGEWAVWLADVARRLRQTLLSYRDGTRVVAAADLTESAQLVVFDLALQVLTAAGFELRLALLSVVTLFDFTLGATFEEQAEPSHRLTGRHNKSGTLRTFPDPTRLPLLTAALQEIDEAVTGDRSPGFEAGVHLILAGMLATQMTANTGDDVLSPSA